MSWFQVSEDYKVSSCGEKEFPEIGWAPIIDDNGAWGCTSQQKLDTKT